MEMNMLSNPQSAESAGERANSPMETPNGGDHIETHWSRILYCDLLSGADDARISPEIAAYGSAPLSLSHSCETHETKSDRR